MRIVGVLPGALATYAIAILIEPVRIGPDDTEAAMGYVWAVEVGRRRRDAHGWVRPVAATVTGRMRWILLLRKGSASRGGNAKQDQEAGTARHSKLL